MTPLAETAPAPRPAGPAWTGYLLGTAGNFAAVGIATAVNLAAVPLALRHFGAERYGAMAIIMTLLTYLVTTNLGVPTAAGVLAAKAPPGPQRLRVLLTAALAAAALSAAAAAALAALWALEPGWLRLLGRIPAEHRAEIERAARRAALLFLAGLPLGVLVQGFTASQRMHVERLYATAGTLLGLAALLVVVVFQQDLSAYFTLRGLALLVVAAAGALHFLLGSPENRRALLEPRRLLAAPPPGSELGARSLWISSARLFLMSLAGLLVWNTDNLVISHFFGLSAVTPYAVTFRFVTIAFILFTGLNAALAPLYGRASAQGDFAWIHRTYNRITILAPMLGGLVWLGAVLFAEPMIAAWAGPTAFGGALMVFALGGYGYCTSLAHSHYTALTSMNLIENGVAIGWSEGLANLALSLLLARPLGPAGVALGTFLASLGTVFWLLPREIARRTQGRVSFEHCRARRHFSLVLAPLLAAALAALRLGPSLPLRLAGGSTLLLLYCAGCYACLPQELRDFLARRDRWSLPA